MDYILHQQGLCGTGYSKTLPGPLQGRIPPDVWNKIINKINDTNSAIKISLLVLFLLWVIAVGSTTAMVQLDKKTIPYAMILPITVFICTFISIIVLQAVYISYIHKQNEKLLPYGLKLIYSFIFKTLVLHDSMITPNLTPTPHDHPAEQTIYIPNIPHSQQGEYHHHQQQQTPVVYQQYPYHQQQPSASAVYEYQQQQQQQIPVYQEQIPAAAVYQQQQIPGYQHQIPAAAVYQQQLSTVYEPPVVYQEQSPAVVVYQSPDSVDLK